MKEDELYLQLHKLSPLNSQEELDKILTTIWETRRTGLRSPEKSHFQSLLNLSSLGELDPVLACLRSLVRKCVRGNFSGDDLLKLFPPDLSMDLESMLVLVLQKNQNNWREEISREQQHISPRTSVSNQIETNVLPSLMPLPDSDSSRSLWHHQDDPYTCFSANYPEGSSPITSDFARSQPASISLQHDCAVDNLEILPRLKSMTWTMENPNSPLANRAAIITLKLQDYPKSSSEETEVKFQVTRDKLEAMLASITYVNEHHFNVVQEKQC